MNFLTEGIGNILMRAEMAPTLLGSKLEAAKMTRKYSPFDDKCNEVDCCDEGVHKIPKSAYAVSPQRGGIRNDYVTKRKRKVEMIKYGSEAQLLIAAEAIDYDDEEAQFDDIYDKAVQANSASFLNTVASDLHNEVMDVVNHMSSSAKRDFEYVTACIQLAVNKTSVGKKILIKEKKSLLIILRK